MRHEINRTEDGYSNWVEVTKSDEYSGTLRVEFSSTLEKGSKETHTKHEMFLTPDQLGLLASQMLRSLYELE